MNSKIKNTKGITLVELIITLIIAAFLGMAVLTFVNISAKTTDEMSAQQVLQQESSMISEHFCRYVRRGVTVSGWRHGAFIIPEDDTIQVEYIRVNYPDSSYNLEFKIDGDLGELQIIKGTNKPQNISTRLCTAENTTSFFIVYPPNGKGVTLTLTLEYKTNRKTHIYTTTIGSVRCKN